jgi:hypothetical protein
MPVQADAFREFVEVIVFGDGATAIGLLEASPPLAKASAAEGATRQASQENFFEQIAHYIYAGDTALHMAAAACQPRIADALIAAGADPRAPNGNGSTPLLLATQTTGRSGSGAAEAKAQQKEILRLLDPGATLS